jgi:hypothetical protein
MPDLTAACCRRLLRGRGGSYHAYGYHPGGFHLPGWLIAVIVLYVILHVLAGHARHRLGGRRVSYGWSVLRGPWFSLRLTRHLRWRS